MGTVKKTTGVKTPRQSKKAIVKPLDHRDISRKVSTIQTSLYESVYKVRKELEQGVEVHSIDVWVFIEQLLDLFPDIKYLKKNNIQFNFDHSYTVKTDYRTVVVTSDADDGCKCYCGWGSYMIGKEIITIKCNSTPHEVAIVGVVDRALNIRYATAVLLDTYAVGMTLKIPLTV